MHEAVEVQDVGLVVASHFTPAEGVNDEELHATVHVSTVSAVAHVQLVPGAAPLGTAGRLLHLGAAEAQEGQERKLCVGVAPVKGIHLEASIA